MALEGSLRDFDLFALFNMIKTQGKSGTLVLSRGQEFVKIFFDQGDIVGCDSNQVRMEDRVGAMLVRLGRLSGDELLGMIQKQRQTLKRMGTLLLESGKVSAQDLQDALFNQAMSIIYRTFRWIEGDYRFDSILPLDLDRENFPPIPVDTVLMEAARIMDEWPEVQRRLPDGNIPLKKTDKAMAMRLDIDQEVSSVFDGRGNLDLKASGLSHEQETVLTYFTESQSIQSVIQITRYDELDTCKVIAELLEAGLLEISQEGGDRTAPPAWRLPMEARPIPAEPAGPSPLLWPLVALLILVPIFTYVPWTRRSLNQGLASLQPSDVRSGLDRTTHDRMDWAFRMASPADGGVALAREMGTPLDQGKNPVPDFTKVPDTLLMVPPPSPLPPATPAAKP
jgi:hypothetical protein